MKVKVAVGIALLALVMSGCGKEEKTNMGPTQAPVEITSQAQLNGTGLI
ncbi:hypothetical protein [Demequina sp.]